MAKYTTSLTVKVVWWLKLYFLCLAVTAAITGREPNWIRVNYWIRRGVKARPTTGGRWH